jgi:hypothetical protein
MLVFQLQRIVTVRQGAQKKPIGQNRSSSGLTVSNAVSGRRSAATLGIFGLD